MILVIYFLSEAQSLCTRDVASSTLACLQSPNMGQATFSWQIAAGGNSVQSEAKARQRFVYGVQYGQMLKDSY